MNSKDEYSRLTTSSFGDNKFLNKKQLNAKKRNATLKGRAKHVVVSHEESRNGHASKYVFFWRKNSPFSQWYRSSFTLDDQVFCCCEQYMMYQKALLFNDLDIAQQILATKDPKEHKSLGRMVSNFESSIWDAKCQEIVYNGNVAKFSQNKILYDTIMCPKFEGREFVEASPVDSIWGIGLDEDKARVIPPSQWRGKNYLGKILTRVRDEFLVNPPPISTCTD